MEKIKRKNTDELFHFMFAAQPLLDTPEAKDVSGAYINCWVNEDDYSIALKKAKDSIEAENWKIDKLDEWMICSRKYYQARTDLNQNKLDEILRAIEEAFACGLSRIFNCWDKDAPDANEKV